MPYYNTPKAPATTTEPKSKPFIKIYLKDASGKRIDDTEIALWKNTSKTKGKDYLSGKDKKGLKYVGFFSE
jgi:hypothetical protein